MYVWGMPGGYLPEVGSLGCLEAAAAPLPALVLLDMVAGGRGCWACGRVGEGEDEGEGDDA